MPVNKTVQLPIDLDSQPIQVLSPVESTAVVGTSAGASTRVALPASSEIVEVAFTDTVHWFFTTSAGTATSSMKIGVGVGVYRVPVGATHMAFIPVSGVAGALGSVTRLI